MKSGLLVLFSFGHFANDFAPVGMYLLIPAFGAAMGLSPSEIGLLFTIHALGSALIYVPAGVLTDYVANRGVLLVATFFWVGIGYFGASFADNYWTFAILIALAGMGDAAWHPIATGVLAQVYGKRRAYALGVHAVGGHMSEVLALIVSGFLLSLVDWRTATQIMVIPGLVMGIVFLFAARIVPRLEASKPTRADLSDVWQTWTSRSGVRVIGLFTFYNMSLFAILSMTPLYLQDAFSYSWRETATALALMMVFGALAQPAMGKFSDRIGRRTITVLGNSLAALAAFGAWWFPGVVPSLLCLGTALTILVAIRAVLLAAAVDHAGRREGTSLGLAFAFMDGLGATAAVLAGIVGEINLALAFLLASLFSALAVALALAGHRDTPLPVLETS